MQALVRSLRPKRHVLALWEGGSASFDRVDRWSDLDLYVLVEGAKVLQTFQEIERALRAISPISETYVVQLGFEGVSQKFYKLRDAGEFAIVDLAVLTPESREMFLAPEVHGKNVFHFNKSGAAKVRHLDRSAQAKKRRDRALRLKTRFAIFNNYVTKEIGRGHQLEALEDYRAITLSTLIEALRIRYTPVHFDFRAHYVDSELPPGVVKRLRRLSYVTDVSELREKYAEATDWCREVLNAVAR